jgi:hypothetical protein
LLFYRGTNLVLANKAMESMGGMSGGIFLAGGETTLGIAADHDVLAGDLDASGKSKIASTLAVRR